MNTNQVDSAPENKLVYDISLALLLAAVVAAVLYPESFIFDFPLIGSEKLFPLTLLMPLLVGAALVLAVLGRKRIVLYPVDGAVFAFALYIMLRNVTGDHPLFTVRYVLVGLSVYYLAALLAVDEERLKRIFYSLSVIVIVTAVYGIIEYIAQDNFLYGQHVTVGKPADMTHRVGSFLSHPVVYGAFLVQVLPFALFLWLRGWKRWLRWTGLTAFILAVICLLLTLSKGSWIAAFMLGVIAAVYFTRTRGKRSVTIALSLFLVVALSAAVYINRSSLEDVIRFGTSVDVRTTTWDGALAGIGEHPVFGVGIKNGQEEVNRQISPEWEEEEDDFNPPVDNYYLNIILEEGIIGGALWTSIIILVIAGGFRQVMIKRNTRFMLVAAFLSIIGLMVNMMTFDAFLIWPNMIMFWLAAGLLRGQYGREEDDSTGQPHQVARSG